MVFEAFNFDPASARPADWARLYRGIGWNPVPAHMPQEDAVYKRPVVSIGGWKEFQAAPPPQMIFDRWYGPTGQYATRPNMGTICGQSAGRLVVFDFDTGPGKNGLLWFSGLLAVENNGIAPETVRQRTGGGGEQWFFIWPEDQPFPPTIKTPIGVDIRSEGGFAMLPPSLHLSGRHYAWIDGCEPWTIPVALAPSWLVEAAGKLTAQYAAMAGQHVERTPSAEDVDPFGVRVDGREERMRDIVWGVVADLRREFPGQPDPARVESERERAWARYLLEVKTRINGVSNEDGLEREGRGRTAFLDKWDRALAQWNDKLAEAAAVPKPDPRPNPDPARTPWFDPWRRTSVPPFPLDVLTAPLAAFVEHQRRTIGADPAGVAMAALTVASGAIDQRCVVKMRRTGDWYAPPRLWTALIGESATKKTPILNGALRPLRAYEARFAAERAADLQAWSEKEKADQGAKPPPATRLIMNSATIEAASEILSRQDRGLLVVHDELSSFIASMDRYTLGGTGGGDRAFWLMAHNGGPYMVDRVQQSRAIKNLCVAFLGGIQPERYRDFADVMADGLTQRFLPILIGRGLPAGEVENDLPAMIFSDLIGFLIGHRPMTFELNEPARTLTDAFFAEVFELEEAGEALGQGFVSWIGKLPGYLGSLSLLLHLVENRTDAANLHVGEATVGRAVRIIREFLLPHGRAFYQNVIGTGAGDDLRAIGSYLLTSELETFSPSDLRWNIWPLREVRNDWEMRGRLAPFVTGGWLNEAGRNWSLVPGVRETFAERHQLELERKAKIIKRLNHKGEEANAVS